jgi:ribosomal protein S27AE
MAFQGGENLTQNTQNGLGAGVPVGFEYFEDDSGRVKSLLAELQSGGVVLSIKGDQLVFDAPAKAMTDDLLARLRADRAGLVEALRVPADQVGDDRGDDRGGDPPTSSSGRPKVVHLKRDPFDVRIDRASKWGNPFRIGPDGDRAEVIRKYRAWVVEQADLMAALPELRGKVLGCWCHPSSCHGDVLAELVAALDRAEPADDPDPIVTSSIKCPFCESIDLADDPGGLWCGSCHSLSWVATDEGGLARRDVAEIELVDPDLVPICPSCRRWCDVMTLAESWRCSKCDPEADDRRRRTFRVLSLVSRSRG